MSRPYGWTAAGHVIDTEAAILRDTAATIAAGGSFASAVADLNARGIPTSTGKGWAIPTLTRTLRNPRIIGKMDVDGQLVAHPKSAPILDEETWTKIVEILDDDTRQKHTRRTRRKHLATGFFRCEVCGDHCYVTTLERRPPELRGNCGHSSVDLAIAETELTERVLSRITTKPWLDALTDATNLGADYYRTLIADFDRRMIILAETFGAGDTDTAALESGVAAARAVRSDAVGKLALVEAMGGLPAVTDREVVEWWATRASLDDQRTVLATVVDWVGLLPVKDVSDRERFVFHWL